MMVKWKNEWGEEVRAFDLYHRARDRDLIDLPEGWVPLELEHTGALVAARPLAEPRYRVTMDHTSGPVEVRALVQEGMRLKLDDVGWRAWAVYEWVM
jgi:hypothetical protein